MIPQNFCAWSVKVCMKENEQQASKAKYEEALEKLRESGLVVEDVTEDGAVEIFVGGVRPSKFRSSSRGK
jgi:hypothetical protein